MNDTDDSANLSIHIHINGFQLGGNTPLSAFHDSQGIVDWSKIIDCHQKKSFHRSTKDIVGIFKCRLGVPNKPTLRDRFTLRSLTNTLSSTVDTVRLGLDKNEEKSAIDSLGSPIILGLFTGSMDAVNLMVQDMGFYHVPSTSHLSSFLFPSNSDPLGYPLRSCKIKIINLAPLVQDNLEIDYGNDEVKDEQEGLLLRDQQKVWIGIHNQIFNSIAKGRQKVRKPALEEKLDSISI